MEADRYTPFSSKELEEATPLLGGCLLKWNCPEIPGGKNYTLYTKVSTIDTHTHTHTQEVFQIGVHNTV